MALQGAQPPTGKKLMVRCDTEDATRKYQIFFKKNEAIRKQTRKYRARFWAVNQIEDSNLEEEQQDIVCDLLDEAVIADTCCEDVIPEESSSLSKTHLKEDEDSEKLNSASAPEQSAAENAEGPGDVQQPNN